MTEFTHHVLTLIASIPEGRAASYGQIAAAAGNPRGARQVARILHSCASSHNLPWHRVVNSKGEISLPEGGGREEQLSLLVGEGIVLSKKGSVDLTVYGYSWT